MNKIKNLKNALAQHFSKLYTAIADNKKAFIVLLYIILIHFTECVAFLIGKINGTLFNPFWQGLGSWLAIFAIALLCKNIVFKCILTVVIVVQALEAAFSVFLSLVFSLQLRADAFAVLAVSSPEEIKEFCQLFVTPLTLFMIVLLMIMIICVLIFLWKITLKKNLYLYFMGVILLLPQGINMVRYCLRGDYKSIYNRNSIGKLIESISEYKNSNKYLVKMAKNPVLPKNISTSNQENITCVLVIGESANRFHHSLYAYPRDTSPELNKRRNEMLIFDNVISGYANTVQSCSYMFTSQEISKKNDFSHSFIDVFRAAGFKISFISNQRRWGAHDSPISFMTTGAHERYYLQEIKAGSYDDAIYPVFCKAIDSKVQKKLIILHLMGSHATYNQRYPENEAVFNASNRTKYTPYRINKVSAVDEYDNSILFTDKLLGKICDVLSHRDEPTFMLYVSDHGEFPEQIKRMPRSGASKSPEHYEIPFILYANRQYRNKFTKFWNTAGKNVNCAFITDWLMYPLYSAAGINYDGFPEKKNLFSSSYEPPAQMLLGDSSTPYVYRKNPYLQNKGIK